MKFNFGRLLDNRRLLMILSLVTSVIIWLVINELLSILENVSAIGAPVPGFMQALLKKLKVHTEDTAEENLPGEENSDE